MSSTTFVDKSTVINTNWLNDVNGVVWTLFGGTTSPATARTALGLGTIATQAASSVAITGGTITGLGTPLPVASGGTGVTTSTGTGNNVLSANSTLTGTITLVGHTVNAAGITISSGDLALNGGVTRTISSTATGALAITVPNSLTLTYDNDGSVGAEVFNIINNSTSVLKTDTVGTVFLGNSGTATGYTSAGDLVLPATRAVRAINTTKAWVKFDGTPTGAYPITLSITAGYNVTNVTKHGIGQYTLNFTNALADANYVVTGMAGDAGSANVRLVSGPRTSAPTTTAFRFTVTDTVPTNSDAPTIYMHVIGN